MPLLVFEIRIEQLGAIATGEDNFQLGFITNQLIGELMPEPSQMVETAGHSSVGLVLRLPTLRCRMRLFSDRICYQYSELTPPPALALNSPGRYESDMLNKGFCLTLGFVLANAFSILAAEQSPTGNAPNSADQAELLRLEKLWNDSHLYGDAEALDRLWDNDLTVIVPKMKVISRKDALGMFRSGRVKFIHYETNDLSLHVYGNAAIVTGRLLRTRKMNEQEMQDNWRFSKVYIRRGSDWRVVLWQASDAL